MFRFRTLGSIELHVRDGRSAESVLQHPKRLSLLACLCSSHPPTLHRRDTLVALLWPELDEAHARGALRQELYQLRRALGPGVVRGDRGDAVGIDPARLWCDAQEFEAALAAGRPEEALALWRGEYLPGLHVGASEFERWLAEARDRLSRRAAEAARELATAAEAAGDGAAAIGWVRRLTELAPYDETGWRRLILLLDRQGDRAGALAEYDRLAKWLRTELEVEPSPETSALVEHIRARGETFVSAADGMAMSLAGSRSQAETEPRGRWPLAERRSLAVIGLEAVENQTGDPAANVLARRITDRLAQALAGATFVDVAGVADQREVSAVVSATLYRAGEVLEIVPRLAEPGPGRRLVDMPRPVQLAPSGRDEGERLNTLAAHVLASVATHYDPRFDGALTAERTLRIPTPRWEAYLEYIQGSELFGNSQFCEGYRHLLRAYQIDCDFVKAGVFAAIALAASGESAPAEELAIRAMSPGRPLCEYERSMGEWFLANLRGRRADAYRAAIEGTAVTSSPVTWYLAAREAGYLNRPREALRLLDGFMLGQGWWRHLTEPLEFLGGVMHTLSDHRAELASALEGRAAFPGSVELLQAEVRARAALGEADQVEKLAEDALALPAGLRPSAGVAWVGAQELSVHGQPAAAARIRRTALDWLSELRDPSPADARLRARLLLETGDLAGAAAAVAALPPAADLESLELAGLAAAHAGDSASARQVLAQLEGLENPYLAGRHLLLAAGIRAVLDSPEAAATTLRRAFAAGLPFGVELHALPSLQPLAHCPAFRALLRPRG